MTEEIKILSEKPPVYERAKEQFGIDWDNGVIFAYAPYIYCKKGEVEDKDTIVHEAVHIRQQMSYPGGVVAWWERYFTDPKWRLDQEVEAYRAQYQYVLKNCPQNAHFYLLQHFGKTLASIYGLEGMSKSLAMNLIRKPK